MPRWKGHTEERMHCIALYSSSFINSTIGKIKKEERKEMGRDKLSGWRARGDRIYPNITCILTYLLLLCFSLYVKINLRKCIEWSLIDICAEVIIGELCWYPRRINEQMDGTSSWINTQHSKMRSCWNSGVKTQGMRKCFYPTYVFEKFLIKISGKGTTNNKNQTAGTATSGKIFLLLFLLLSTAWKTATALHATDLWKQMTMK